MSRLVEGRLGTAFIGLVFTALIIGLSALGIAYGFGVFSSSKTVTADLPEAGPALGPGSEVQYRGVLVGSLGGLRREPNRAVLTIDLDPSQIDHIPSGVTVRLVPRSVFGDLYVDLVPPAHVTGHIQPGAVLRADTSTPAVELNQALDSGYQLLTAIKPATLDQTLTSIATALNGRGSELGAVVSQAARYTAEVAPHTAQLIHDVAALGKFGATLSANAPNLIRITNDSIALSQSISADQPTLTKLLQTGPLVATQTKNLLADDRGRLNTLVHQLQPVISILEPHQARLKDTVTQLQAFLLGAAKALGHGPYLQVAATIDTKLSRGRAYTAADCPRYRNLAGANCPHGTSTSASNAIIQALVDRASGSTTTNPKNPNAMRALKQRLAIAGVLLAPVLKAVGGVLP